MRHTILAVGRLKKGAETELITHYTKQMRGTLTITELVDAPSKLPAATRKAQEAKALMQHIAKTAHVIALDARGQQATSPTLAQHVETARNQGKSQCYWIIGGQDGLDDSILSRANFTLAFGGVTWPHKLARIMLAEQIYRAESILAGHPYHLGH